MESPIAVKKNSDEPMNAARIKALRTFKYFWRESSWEARRILPGMGAATVKLGIKTDGTGENVPESEHMWFSDVDFDGVTLSGHVNNEPRWVSTLKLGDRVQVKLEDLSDWLYSIHGRAYGGFSVQLMRSEFDPVMRAQHDEAWGLEFGDPNRIAIVPGNEVETKGFLGIFKGRKKLADYCDGDDIPEHPMSLNMAEKCEEGLKQNPKPFIEPNDSGSTMLHYDALAGNLTQVKLLLKYGADKNYKDANGMTPRDLAAVLKWDRVIQTLT